VPGEMVFRAGAVRHIIAPQMQASMRKVVLA
jgi:hypothetical protein